MSRQRLSDRVLHRLALGSKRFRRFCFERECERNSRVFDRHRENVFIAGMARSGSTTLLTGLHTSGDFAATSYRLMPLLLAPSLATLIGRFPASQVAPGERRHADAIDIDIDSVEALDGVFWDTYLNQGELDKPGCELPQGCLQRYALFIENLLIHSGQQRYLSKMNQNIALLGNLCGYFERSLFLVPFRDPLQQASSLLRQHGNFARLSGYEKTYLGWLGHHEFGATHRGFIASADQAPSKFNPDNLNYWLEQWKNGYNYLLGLANLHTAIIPVCYEQMADSSNYPKRLAQRLNSRFADGLFINCNKAELAPGPDVDALLLADCQAIYRQLSILAEARLC